MTNADRLTGLPFVLVGLAVALAYGFVLGRRGRRWPWLLAIGAGVVGAGAMAPSLPVMLVGATLMAWDLAETHRGRMLSPSARSYRGPRGRHRLRRPAARRSPRRTRRTDGDA